MKVSLPIVVSFFLSLNVASSSLKTRSIGPGERERKRERERERERKREREKERKVFHFRVCMKVLIPKTGRKGERETPFSFFPTRSLGK